MKTLIFCEGTTDVLLIQFVLQFKYGWKYKGFLENKASNRLVERELVKEEREITIRACGGINNIPMELQKLKDKITYATQTEEICHKIIVMIDHDTIDSNQIFVQQLNEALELNLSEMQLSIWNVWKIENVILGMQKVDLYIKSIPEKETGAIEKIMLEALRTDEIEHDLIQQCEGFIEEISETQNRYLQKKSRIYKAIFNTYFAIRTPEEKYDERARILKAYDWENNEVLNNSFDFLNI